MKKFFHIFVGFCLAACLVYAGTLTGCAMNKTTDTSSLPLIKDSHSAISSTSKDLQGTTTDIESNAKSILQKTPVASKPILDPHTNQILQDVGQQKQMVKNLDSVTAKLAEAEKVQVQHDQADAKKDKLIAKLQGDITSAYRKQIMGWSTICFFAALVCAGAAIYMHNALLAWISAVCGAGLVVCVFLISFLPFIPWVILGLLVIAIAVVFIHFYLTKKNTKNLANTNTNLNQTNQQLTQSNQQLAKTKATLNKATQQLTETVEAMKPAMPPTARLDFFGHGPVPGKVKWIQSEDTQQIVAEHRSNLKSLAPSISPSVVQTNTVSATTVADDFQQLAVTVSDYPSNSVTTVAKTKTCGGRKKIGGPTRTGKIILR